MSVAEKFGSIGGFQSLLDDSFVFKSLKKQDYPSFVMKTIRLIGQNSGLHLKFSKKFYESCFNAQTKTVQIPPPPPWPSSENKEEKEEFFEELGKWRGVVNHEVGHAMFTLWQAKGNNFNKDKKHYPKKHHIFVDLFENGRMERVACDYYPGMQKDLQRLESALKQYIIEFYKQDPTNFNHIYYALRMLVNGYEPAIEIPENLQKDWQVVKEMAKKAWNTKDERETIDIAIKVQEYLQKRHEEEEKEEKKAQSKEDKLKKELEDLEDMQEALENMESGSGKQEDQDEENTDGDGDKNGEEDGEQEGKDSESKENDAGEKKDKKKISIKISTQDSESDKSDDVNDKESDEQSDDVNDKKSDKEDKESDKESDKEDDKKEKDTEDTKSEKEKELEKKIEETKKKIQEQVQEKLKHEIKKNLDPSKAKKIDPTKKFHEEHKDDRPTDQHGKDVIPLPLFDYVDNVPVKTESNYKTKELLNKGMGPICGMAQRFIQKVRSRRHVGVRTYKGRVNRRKVHRYKYDRNIFKTENKRLKKDASVFIAIDCSGSMSGIKIQTARKAALVIGEMMSQAKVEFEIKGFTIPFSNEFNFSCFTREANLVHYRFGGSKDWQQTKHSVIEGRLTKGLQDNDDGESLRHFAAELEQSKKDRKMMIVISDGEPCAGCQRGDGRKDLYNVIQEIRQKNIEVYAVGIGTNATKYYGEQNSVNLNANCALDTLINNIGKFVNLIAQK